MLLLEALENRLSVESVVEDCIIEQGNVEALKDKIISGEYKCKENLMLGKEDMLKFNAKLNKIRKRK